MKIFTSIALLAALAFIAMAPASAGIHESHVYTNNETTDAWVWVTAYEVGSAAEWINKGAWCVAPGKNDQHGLRANIERVRFEVTNRAGCLHPLVLNVYENFPRSLNTMTYYLRKRGAHYDVSSR